MKIHKILPGLLGGMALFAYAGIAWANIAGHVEFVHGAVQVTSTAGRSHALQKGDAVNEGDTIVSAKHASAQIRMEDGGFIAVRQDTRMKIDRFEFSKKPNAPEHSFFSLLKGGFRAITGLIGRIRHEDYRITTPVATIGIRGTDHETFYTPIPLPGIPAGAYSKVNKGETTLTTNSGTINVLPNQMGFAGGINQMPEIQPVNTRIFTVTPPPTPESAIEKQGTAQGNGSGGSSQQSAQDMDNGEPIRDTAVVDNTSQTDNTALSSSPETSSTTTTVESPQLTIPVTATSSSLTLDTTTQTVSSGGSTVTVQNGVYSALAQAAATAAATAAGATDFSLALSSSGATTSVNSAASAVNTALSLTVDTATAASNAASSTATATSAQTTTTNANNAYVANGSFADSTAVTANTTVQNANTALQTANTSVQTANTNTQADDSNLTTAQAAANTAYTAASNSLTTANTNLGNLSAELTNLGNLISANSTVLTGISVPTTLQQAVTVAQQAADLALTLQNAGDFTDANIAYQVAQSAANVVTYALVANTAITNASNSASTASAQASAAQTAATQGATDVGTTTTQLATANSNATTITTNAPIAAYNNPAVVANFIGHAVMPVAAVGGYNLGESPDSAPAANTTYVLDGSGNLVEARNMSFQTTDLQSLSTAGGGVSYTSADITWSGGTAADTFKLADNSIYAGRWVNPTVTVTDNSTSAVTSYNPVDSLWAVLQAPASGYVQGLTGSATYTMAGHTTPFDALGNLGTFNSASLTADFTNQVVNATVNVTMGTGPMAGTFAVNGSNLPIKATNPTDPAGFGGGSVMTASCSGTCAAGAGGYSATLGGSFAGSAAASAGLGYNIWPTTSAGTPATDLVQGLVAFSNGSGIVATAPYVNSDISYAFASSFGGQTASGSSGSVSPMVNPTSMSGSYNCNNCTVASWNLAVSGGTPTSSSDATTGINWGYWSSPTSATFNVTGSGYTGTTGTISSPGPIDWIDAPSTDFYVPVAQTGTASYGSLGGAATDGTGTYIITAGSLSVDFTKQLVTSMSLSVGTAVAGTLVNITGSNAPLEGGPGDAGFYFCTAGAGCTGGQYGTLTATNTTSGTYDGTASGALTGASLNGAILGFDLYGSSGSYPGAPPYSISGVAALTLSTGSINTGAQYQVGLSSIDMIPTTPYPSAAAPYPVTQDMVSGNVFSPSTLVTDVNGNPTQWQNNNNGSMTAYLGILGAATVTITGGTAYNHGTDSVSGISWGRWAGGTLKYVSLANGGTASIGNTAGGLHWISLPAMSGPLSLPVSGTFNYTLAGATTPTDQAGNTGVLNSATLSANFSAMTVNVGANVTVSGTTFNGSATGVPIQHGAYFEVGNGSGTFGTLTCSGTCGASNSGHVVGAFTQNGVGAGVSYGFETGPSSGSPTKVISGVAAFHR